MLKSVSANGAEAPDPGALPAREGVPGDQIQSPPRIACGDFLDGFAGPQHRDAVACKHRRYAWKDAFPVSHRATAQDANRFMVFEVVHALDLFVPDLPSSQTRRERVIRF